MANIILQPGSEGNDTYTRSDSASTNYATSTLLYIGRDSYSCNCVSCNCQTCCNSCSWSCNCQTCTICAGKTGPGCTQSNCGCGQSTCYSCTGSCNCQTCSGANCSQCGSYSCNCSTCCSTCYNGPYRSFIRFDLSSIPADAVVSSASLSLKSSTYNSGSIEAWRVTGFWNETDPTWSSMPAVDAAYLASITGASGWNDFSLTTAVQNWINGTWANYGVCVRRPSDTNNDMSFISSDHATAADRPKLDITYTIPSTGVWGSTI